MDSSQQLPDEFIQLCQSVTAKRPKAVIDHIYDLPHPLPLSLGRRGEIKHSFVGVRFCI
jgi:hypothetical protein